MSDVGVEESHLKAMVRAFFVGRLARQPGDSGAFPFLEFLVLRFLLTGSYKLFFNPLSIDGRSNFGLHRIIKAYDSSPLTLVVLIRYDIPTTANQSEIPNPNAVRQQQPWLPILGLRPYLTPRPRCPT